MDHCCRKALEPEYVASNGVGIRPPNEPIVRIRPRLLGTMCGITSCVTLRVERQFMLIMFSISCWEVSANGTGILCDCPTLLIRIAICLLSRREERFL